MSKEEKSKTKKEDKKETFSLKDFVQPIAAQQNQSEQYKILQELLNADNNLQLKTEINKPFTFSVIDLYSKFLKDNGFTDSSELIEHFITQYLKYSISKKRAGRKEIVEALKSLGIQSQLNMIPNTQNLPPIQPK